MSGIDTRWDFVQLTGSPKKSFSLDGYAAPFGRPRGKAVMKELLKSRISTTHYPGRSGRPTRHSFGVNWEPMELTGRWMTRMLPGTQTANQLADTVKAFMLDERTCQINWGYIVSYIGYIEELELNRESEHHIAWRMKILVDTNLNDKPIRSQKIGLAGQSDSSLVDDSIEFALKTASLRLPTVPNLNSGFLDSLDFLFRQLNAPSAAINKLAGNFADIEQASFAALGHFRSALKGFEQAFVDFRNLIMDTQIDAGNFARTTVSDIDWIQYQLNLELHGNDILALMAAMDRKAEQQQQQQFTAVITARSPDFTRGESWESISIRATGTANNAAKIQAANGGGGHAVPGETYIVP